MAVQSREDKMREMGLEPWDDPPSPPPERRPGLWPVLAVGVAAIIGWVAIVLVVR